MNTNVLAAGVAGFLIGGLVVSVAAQFEEPPAHEPAGMHQPQSPSTP